MSIALRAKSACRRVLASGLYHSGLLRLVRHAEQSRCLRKPVGSRWPRLQEFQGSKFGILCYHRVGTEGVPLFSRLLPRVFEEQIRYVRKHYRVVSLGQLCAEMRDAVAVPPTLAITFDDGYRDLYTHALPVLREYGIPATIYLIGRCMETGEAPWYDRVFVALATAKESAFDLDLDTVRRFVLSSPAARLAATWEIVCYLRSISDADRRRWCARFEQQVKIPEVPLKDRILSWEQVRTMRRDGIFFGAHTMTHPAVSQLDATSLDEELGRSKELLESRLDTEISDFAYPFGKPADRSPAAEQFLMGCGYRSAVTTTAGVNLASANPLALFRLQVSDDRSLTGFALNLSRLFLEVVFEEQKAQPVTVSNTARRPQPHSRGY